MTSVHPSQGEKFYLRLLLKHKANAINERARRTVNGVEYPTFRAACVAMNLIEDDLQWHDCLQEATLTTMPSAIRVLFCNMLVQHASIDPLALHEAHENAMKEDF